MSLFGNVATIIVDEGLIRHTFEKATATIDRDEGILMVFTWHGNYVTGSHTFNLGEISGFYTEV